MLNLRRILIPAAGLLLVSAGLLAVGTSQREPRLVITGSSTIAPVMSEIARQFEQNQPGIRVDVQTGGSSRGISDVRRGLADIGMVSRSLHEDEMDLDAHLIARDGICLIVHSSNPVRELSTEQISGLYTGRVTNWRQVGGPDWPVVVVHKATGHSTHELFLDYFGLTDAEVQPDVIIGDNQQGIKTVAGNRAAIGYVSIGSAQTDVQRGVPIRCLPLAGVPATIDQLVAGSYPLTRDLQLVTRPPVSPAARHLIEFARSDRAGELIRGHYFVPVSR